MSAIQELRTRWRQYGKRCAVCCGGVLVCASLCSCMSVMCDMRKLEQPVTMNSNPFACERNARPVLTPIDGYSAKLWKEIGSAAQPGSARNMNQGGGNEAQVEAFKKIGGDNSLTITDVTFALESVAVNVCLAFSTDVLMTATGTVQKVSLPTRIGKEVAK